MSSEDGTGEESLLDELNKNFGNIQGSAFGSYTQDMQKMGFSPDNPYGHAWGLINSPIKDIEKDNMHVLDDPQILLGDIDNEKSLRLYQMDLDYLTNFCQMAIIDEMWKGVFEVLWQKFKNEVRITSAMGGKERQYQAFHIPQMSTKKGFSFLKRGSKKKKQAMDYILPSEEDEGMY